MMNCIFWNCRGANKPNFRRSIRYILKKFSTGVLAIFETHAGGENARKICQGLGLDNSHRVDAMGQSGGLWLLWRSEVGSVTILNSSDQYIHAMVVKDEESLHLIVVYAAPSVSRRSGLWGELTTIIQGISDPLVIGGDFNTIIRADERTGGNGQLSTDSIAFGNWINDLALIDMGFRGSTFTWHRGKTVNTFIAKRLDRVLCNAQTRLKWQEATISHLPFFSSDHAPLYLQLEPVVRGDPRRRPFRFEAAWLSHPSFKELVSTSWKETISTPNALKELKRKLVKWNKDVFGDVQKRKDSLMEKIKGVQDRLDTLPTDTLLVEEEELIKEFELVLQQEEVLWYQKSREKWIALGERNTKYFHTSTIIRRRRNRIEALKDNDGRWIVNASDLKKLAIEYYKKLYSVEDLDMEVENLSREGFITLPHDAVQSLSKPFLAGEVEKSIRSMGKFKAPGPDGYQPVFYQECWNIVGPSVVRFVLDFFESGVLPKETNDALLVLIAKVGKPERITQFRPISLCNVLFKILQRQW